MPDETTNRGTSLAYIVSQYPMLSMIFIIREVESYCWSIDPYNCHVCRSYQSYLRRRNVTYSNAPLTNGSYIPCCVTPQVAPP